MAHYSRWNLKGYIGRIMHRDVLIAVLPHLAVIAGAVGLLWLMVRVSGARLKLIRLARLHRDELGGVQSVAFVLTVPVFIMIMMFIVQWSQLTIAKIVVEYAAFAAARSTVVWIPANLGLYEEQENQISSYVYIEDVEGSDGRTWSVYQVEPGSRKYNKIHFAAAMACMPICPSRNTGADRSHAGNEAVGALRAAYRAIEPGSDANPRIRGRLQNKLAFALEHTAVEIEIRHKDTEPPLAHWDIGPYPDEFAPNEIGWQDQIVVTVKHDFALLPGPGRLLARPASVSSGTSMSGSSGGDGTSSGGSDRVSESIRNTGRVYVFPLSATVRMNNEGEKSVLPYIQHVYGTGSGSGPANDYGDDDTDCNCGDNDNNSGSGSTGLPAGSGNVDFVDNDRDAYDVGGGMGGGASIGGGGVGGGGVGDDRDAADVDDDDVDPESDEEDDREDGDEGDADEDDTDAEDEDEEGAPEIAELPFAD